MDELHIPGEGLNNIFVNSRMEIFRGQLDEDGSLVGRGIFENQIGVIFDGFWEGRGIGEGLITYKR